MQNIKQFVLVSLIVLSLTQLSFSGDRSVRALRQDLSFNVRCVARSASEIELAANRFFVEQGFRVLNVAQSQRARSIDTLLAVDLLALDGKARTVSIASLVTAERDGGSEGRYTVALRTSPPTRRSEELEAALLGFFSITLGCDVRYVTRGVNGADVAALHDHEVERITNELEKLR
jgi:hypothetical protein